MPWRGSSGSAEEALIRRFLFKGPSYSLSTLESIRCDDVDCSKITRFRLIHVVLYCQDVQTCYPIRDACCTSNVRMRRPSCNCTVLQQRFFAKRSCGHHPFGITRSYVAST